MPFGAQLLPEGGTRFRLWAPSSPRVTLELRISGAHEALVQEMRHAKGWHEITVSEAAAGWRYQFVVQSESAPALVVPDPASRSNPDGVHGASAVVDPHAYSWRFPEWSGRSWPDAVIYELHVGTFTEEGNFTAAAQRLPELAELGITALQLMPLAAFPGKRNWGYDGVLQFAPAACYGSPEDLKFFIDTAHGLGLMVLLDVVYNHFGPEGNYLHAFCPEFFNSSQRTPWGAAINFDGKRSVTVRDFFVHNALFWVEEYRFDGLRLDAVHAMHDRSDPDIVSEIARALDHAAGRSRKIHLVLENNANQARYLKRDRSGRPILATAQWDEDVHHSLHVLTSGEADGYYADYAVKPLEKLGRALAEGFAYQGEHSVFRDRARGEPSAQLPPSAFVSFLQNHDMVGNRALGERIHALADPHLLNAAYACLLLSPEVPMLFMGEEFDASTPFMYFCDFQPELAQAVAEGRRQEFKRFAAFANEAARAKIPDPNDEMTFTACKLKWAERGDPGHLGRLLWIRDLLTLRRRFLAPHLAGIGHGGRYRTDSGVLCAQWSLADGALWTIVAHFGADAVRITAPQGELVYNTRALADTDSSVRLESGAVLVTYKQAQAAASSGVSAGSSA
jgi:maltooligosyltrehalose trehalohydrolase